MDIILQADELIKSLYEKGREVISKTSTESNKIRHKNESQLGSIEPSRKTTHNTNEEIAKLAQLTKVAHWWAMLTNVKVMHVYISIPRMLGNVSIKKRY